MEIERLSQLSLGKFDSTLVWQAIKLLIKNVLQSKINSRQIFLT